MSYSGFIEKEKRGKNKATLPVAEVLGPSKSSCLLLKSVMINHFDVRSYALCSFSVLVAMGLSNLFAGQGVRGNITSIVGLEKQSYREAVGREGRRRMAKQCSSLWATLVYSCSVVSPWDRYHFPPRCFIVFLGQINHDYFFVTSCFGKERLAFPIAARC